MSQYHSALHPSRWALVRRAALKRAAWRCEQCGRAGRLEVHHLDELRHGGAPYALTNLLVLCVSCHVEEHRTRRFITPPAQAWAALVEELTPCAS